MTLISLIIPCYNHGRFLGDAINSILAQSVQDFEIIIVDDHSTDDTPDYCATVSSWDSRVRVIRLKENSGTASANNAGMAISNGDYITVMSADDMRERFSFEKLLETCVINPHHFAYDDVLLMNADGKKHDKVWRIPDYDFNTLLTKNTIHTGIMFERRAFIETGGYPPEFKNGREDWAFNLLLGTKGYCGIHIDYAGYVYRRHGANRTLSNTDSASNEKFRQMIKERFSDLYLGRFPMGCCGQRYPVNTSPSDSMMVAEALVGSEGMTAIEYIGGNYGTTTFYGAATGTAYKFDAGMNKKKMVDNRDLHTARSNGLLDLREHTKSLFVISSDQPAPIEPQIAIVEEESGVISEEPEVIESTGTPLETLVSTTSVSYKKLKDSGFDTVEQLEGETVDSLVEKTGISKTSAKALLSAI